MFNYSQILPQLQQQLQQVKSDESLFCISVYLPFNNDTRDSSNTRFKSLVEIQLQKHLSLPEQKHLRLAILAEICAISRSFDISQKGVCVYATFRTGSKYRGGNQKNSNDDLVPFVQVVPIFTLPTKKPSAFIGKLFDLIPLLDNLNFDDPALIIDLHQDEALIYEFTQMKLTLLSHVENSYVKFPEREEYLDQGQLNHSNRKDFNYLEDYLHQFLRDDLTKSLAQYSGQYKTLVIVSPDQYQPQISQFSADLGNQFSEIQTRHLTTNKTPELINAYLSEKMEKQIEKIRQDTIKEITNPSRNLETNLQTILEAAEKGQVETVFVVPNYHTPGFDSENESEIVKKPDLARTDPHSTLETNQAKLYTIQIVIELGGNVKTISGDFLDENPNTIFAKLRY